MSRRGDREGIWSSVGQRWDAGAGVKKRRARNPAVSATPTLVPWRRGRGPATTSVNLSFPPKCDDAEGPSVRTTLLPKPNQLTLLLLVLLALSPSCCLLVNCCQCSALRCRGCPSPRLVARSLLSVSCPPLRPPSAGPPFDRPLSQVVQLQCALPYRYAAAWPERFL